MTEHVNTSDFITIVRLQETTTDGRCYIAYHPELPSCISQGDTPEEAEVNLAEATEMAIEHLLAHGLPIPRPFSLQDATPQAPHTTGYESTEEVLVLPAARVIALNA
jgi:predicted RNase H-like HicB family nuclease